jgi:5-methylthioribose kinase
MHLIDATNAEAYLRDTGRLAPGERVAIRELSGGVSNIVLLVEFPGSEREPFVLKQAREQLRVAQPWFCSPERIWREVEVLRVLEKCLRPSERGERVHFGVPALSFLDEEHFAYAMSYAGPDATPWKSILLAGNGDVGVAMACGRMLAQIHVKGWQGKRWHEKLQDQRFFIDLRLEPYYRHVAERHPPVREQLQQLIDKTLATQSCLVHGDFSPKNLLVSSNSAITLIDFEVGHLGDPAFDIGFFLTHLCLKAIHLPQLESLRKLPEVFWFHYRQRLGASDAAQVLLNEERCVEHLLACMLARIDGKSPVDYLTIAEQDSVRSMCLANLPDPFTTIHDALQHILKQSPSS